MGVIAHPLDAEPQRPRPRRPAVSVWPADTSMYRIRERDQDKCSGRAYAAQQPYGRPHTAQATGLQMYVSDPELDTRQAPGHPAGPQNAPDAERSRSLLDTEAQCRAGTRRSLA